MWVRVVSDCGLSDGAGHRYRTGQVADLGDDLAAAWLDMGYVAPVASDAKHSFDTFGRILPTVEAEPADPVEPPVNGPGSSRSAWAAYAQTIGVTVDPAWSKSDIAAAVKGHDAAAGQP